MQYYLIPCMAAVTSKDCFPMCYHCCYWRQLTIDPFFRWMRFLGDVFNTRKEPCVCAIQTVLAPSSAPLPSDSYYSIYHSALNYFPLSLSLGLCHHTKYVVETWQEPVMKNVVRSFTEEKVIIPK